ncbi:hypothetical protein [Tichowtungia aerotolerans]|uniref:Uncharacterized protein n=1 Tax=Tichowtungia aerotolerans TaxID=2697043 RepID=A0A6P1M9M7_9BACT|nr:hypothetical protein [Tichowtungia aerotolerans]QHI70617.1 hypothetical protein GT409_14605 [Tichowtungia aerotolerans]
MESSTIDDVLEQTLARQEQALILQEASPYPSTGMWRHEDYALAAYWLNTNNAIADAGLIACQTNGLYQEHVDLNSFHWHAYLLERIWFLYSAQSDFFPIRMSAAAEDAVLEMLWDWAAPICRIGFADPEKVHFSWESENHHAQAWVSFWGAAQIFEQHADYMNRTYADGSTPAQMAAAFDNYFKAYVREKTLKGLAIEVASPTYAKYTLNTWLNLADFADDSELQEAAAALLDVYWADWALEHLDGVRGGSRHRAYSGSSSILQSGAESHCWYYFGEGQPLSRHPGSMSAMTTFWRPSRAVVGLVLDREGRGCYEYTSRRLGLRDSSPLPEPPALAGGTYNAVDPAGGSLLRTTWSTPDFVMGVSQVAARPADDWWAASSQNHWNGVVFGGHSTARIFTQRPYPGNLTSVYNAEWGVQHKGAMILQRFTQHKNATGQMVWFDLSLSREEVGGWIFSEAPRAYAAVRIVDGGWTWQPDSTNLQRTVTSTNIGEWAVLNDEYSPIILEVGRKQVYGSMAAFQSEILANSIRWNGTQLDYTSSGYDTTLTLFADESATPRVDGVPLNFEPIKCYDAPYLQGDFEGGPLVINYGGERTVHGVAPFFDDANTIAHWDFETAFPAIHSDSVDSIQQIADGKFGKAVRCNFEAGDQYMMTADAWPISQGTFRYQGWIRLKSGDTGGYLFHVYDQVYLSVDAAEVSFKINRSGDAADMSATNVIELAASISTGNEWQYIEAVYDGGRIKLVTEEETVSAPGIGVFVPNVRTVYIGSRKNRNNFVGDMDEVKISSSITETSFIPEPVVVSATAQHLQKSDPDLASNALSGFSPATGPDTKLVVAASWESGVAVITNITYGGLAFTEAVTRFEGRNASIWYLDEPALSNANVIVQFSAPTDSRIGVLSLQNAAAGAPEKTASTEFLTTIGLTTAVKNSLAVGVYTENGSAALSSDFANTLYSGDSGSSVGNAGFQIETVSGAKTYTWDAPAYSCAAVAASFSPASYIPPIVADDESDSDADGMADAWEIQLFGSMGAADGTADFDGDGFSVAQEFVAGTDPFDADSYLRITGVTDELRWKSVQGKRYRVLTTTNLSEGAWMVEASGIPGGFSESSHPVSKSNDVVYFKVEVE